MDFAGALQQLVRYQWVAVPIAGVVYCCAVAVYRLYLSPLAKLPGPKLAGLTSLYGAYYDLGLGGQYVWAVDEMHRKYGPVVRVRPDAVHVNDPAFIDKLYSQSPKLRRERFYTVTRNIQLPGSILATVDHDMHRSRRAVLNPFFSQQNVRRLEPVINGILIDLLHRMDGWAAAGKPVQMNPAYRAATSDIITSYAFGESGKCLEMEDCNAAFFDVLSPQRVCHLGTYFYTPAVIMASLPPALMVRLVPRIGVFTNFATSIFNTIIKIRESKDLPEGKTIFHEILRSDIPDAEKRTKRVADEAIVMMIAGSETTASTLAALTYHLLADPVLMARLREELVGAMPDINQLPVASKLDGLPFLNALIQETLRLYPGATHRQDRVAPNEDLVVETPEGKTYVIPAGTGIGMTSLIINRHPDIYERPNEFLPDRYLKNPSLQKYQMAFSKGTRQCIGINLAYQELQSLVAGIFRKYDIYDPSKAQQSGPTLQLYETKREDIAAYADYVTPGQYPGSEGLRLIIRK